VTARYRPNQPKVISEMIDGEVVVIHLGTGTYYSLDGTAAVVWDALEQGATTDEVATFLARSHDVPDGADVDGAVDGFVADLLGDDLVVAVDAAPAVAPDLTPPPDRPVFAAPRLERYTDMQDLILLDPVHDVDAEVGWPRAK
jgi:hypothetical protein